MYVCVCACICVCACVCVSLTCCSLLALVGDLKKSYIVWQEIFDNGLKVWRVSICANFTGTMLTARYSLPVYLYPCMQVNPDTVVEVWKGNPDSRAAVTKAGLQAIYSACWYLNIIQYGPDWLAVG